jgi:hypothetical protein
MSANRRKLIKRIFQSRIGKVESLPQAIEPKHPINTNRGGGRSRRSDNEAKQEQSGRPKE